MKPGQVAEKLGLSASTIRKYCILLEDEGYSFKRTPQNSRRFTEDDVMTLERMAKLVKDDGVTLVNAAHAVVKSPGVNSVRTGEDDATEDGVERYDTDVSLLIIEIKELREQLKSRDLLFVQALEDIKKQMDQQQEKLPEPELKEGIPPVKKGFFGRLFK